MRRGEPERIYHAQRAGFVEGGVSRHEATRDRVTAALDALEAECEPLGIERGSPEFWREAERRGERPITSSASMRAYESDGRLP